MTCGRFNGLPLFFCDKLVTSLPAILCKDSRRIQQIVKATAEKAKITKRVYPHLLRHSVATTLLERGMPIEQIQKFLGHSKLETTQIYAESTTEMLKESYRRALSE